MENEIGFLGQQLRRLDVLSIIAVGSFFCFISLDYYSKHNYWIFMSPFIILDISIIVTELIDQNNLYLWHYLVDEYIRTKLEAYTPDFVKRLVRRFMFVGGRLMNMATNLALVPVYVVKKLRRVMLNCMAMVFRVLANVVLPFAAYLSIVYNIHVWRGYPLIKLFLLLFFVFLWCPVLVALNNCFDDDGICSGGF